MLEEKEQSSNADAISGSADNLWINKDGTFGDMATAPAGVADLVTKKGLKNISALTVSYGELEGKLGNQSNLIAIPEQGDVEGFNRMADALGRPKSPEEYTFTRQEKDVDVDDHLLGLFKQVAYKEGMPQAAFESTVRFQLDAARTYVDGVEKSRQDSLDNAQKAIRGRFNTEDEYTDYTKKSLGFAESFKLSEDKNLADVLEDKGLMQDPDILDMLNSLASRVAEAPLDYTKTSHPTSQKARLAAIQANPAFTHALDPNHDKVMAEYWALCNEQPEG
jgi:hypothetical protein